jgi:alkylation response protein AidB-like acyl-CoA dehydrogenase
VPYRHPFRQEFAAWLATGAPTDPVEPGEDGAFAHKVAWQRALFADGWAGLTWPKRFGGREEGPLEQLMQYEELALARAPEPANTPGIILLGPTLMRLGSEQLKERFLPGILSGDDLWCQGFSEPDAGSDLASLRTRARLVDGEWVVDGQKIWSTFADRARWCFVLARTDPNSTRHRGLSLLIVDLAQPGVTIRPIRQITGDHEFSEIFFDGARCPESWVVGQPGEGWAAAMLLFSFERGDPGFTDHARLLVSLHDARPLLTTDRLSAAAFAESRQRWVQLWLRCQELRQLNVRCALEVASGRDVVELGSVTNLVWGELCKDIAELVADLSGPAAILRGSGVSYQRLASRAKSIYSGTSEIQRNIVAERLLRLPR